MPQNLRIDDITFRALREHKQATGCPMSEAVARIVQAHFGLPKRKGPQPVKPVSKTKK